MLDLSKKQKKFFVVKLTNGTTLNIPSPKKRIFEKMTAMNEISKRNIQPMKSAKCSTLKT